MGSHRTGDPAPGLSTYRAGAARRAPAVVPIPARLACIEDDRLGRFGTYRTAPGRAQCTQYHRPGRAGLGQSVRLELRAAQYLHGSAACNGGRSVQAGRRMNPETGQELGPYRLGIAWARTERGVAYRATDPKCR